jgi:hypothetical protein
MNQSRYSNPSVLKLMMATVTMAFLPGDLRRFPALGTALFELILVRARRFFEKLLLFVFFMVLDAIVVRISIMYCPAVL